MARQQCHIEAMASSYHQWCQSSNSMGNVIVACLWFQLHFTSVLETALRFHSTRQRCEAILCSVLSVHLFHRQKKSSKVCLQIFSFLCIATVGLCLLLFRLLPFRLFYFHFVYSTFLLLFTVVSHTQFNVQFNVLWNIPCPNKSKKSKTFDFGYLYIWHMMSVNVPWRNTPKTSTKACKTLVNQNIITELQIEANGSKNVK